jgi:hypothetical protein
MYSQDRVKISAMEFIIRPSTIRAHADKKENQSFLIYKEIQNGAVAKTYMRRTS